MKKYNLFVLVIFFFCVAFQANAQFHAREEKLVKIPDKVAKTLIGIRVDKDILYAVGMNGCYIKYNLTTGKISQGRIDGEPIIDFAIIQGELIYLDGSSKLRGKIRPNWPVKKFTASRISSIGERVVLSGVDKLEYLDKCATKTVEILNIDFPLPLENGYIATMKRETNNRWSLALYDDFGNFIDNIYTFPADFYPTGIELGPVNSIGDMLLSYYIGSKREILIIGKNGHLLRKIGGPNKICKRDLAFDNQGNLLIIDVYGKNIYVSRWNL